MNRAVIDYFRCPESLVTFALRESAPLHQGYFQLGPSAVCYGRCSSKRPAKRVTDPLPNVLHDVAVEGKTVLLPFDPSEITENLRYERYASCNGGGKRQGAASLLRAAYYTLRPLLSVSVRKHLQRMHLRDWEEIRFPNWPVDSSVERIFEELMMLLLRAHALDRMPFIWFWPDGLPACAMMTHDVESSLGRDLCSRLMDLDDSHGIKSSFEIVPEGRYTVSNLFLDEIRKRGFEIDIHDLDHDGRLFTDHKLFLQRVGSINRYGMEFGADGFRSAILYRNVDWFEEFEFAYDMSVPSVGSLEAQAGGCCSVTPFFIGDVLELPVTTTQDYCLFHILNQHSIDLWKRQIQLITRQHGLATFIVHPDYVFKDRALEIYKALLEYLGHLRSERKMWLALPREVNEWWRQRSEMKLVHTCDGWEIQGRGKERARIAYASIEGNRVVYHLQASSRVPPKAANVA